MSPTRAVLPDSNSKTIAFPLGGVAAGSLSLGGRGQLRDWEIFNRPNKGFSPAYALPSIWVQTGNSKPIARVLRHEFCPRMRGKTARLEEPAWTEPHSRSDFYR